MKINRGRSDRDKIIVTQGDFAHMMETRKEETPHIEKSINDILKDYSGEMVAVILIEEDENGNPSDQTVFISGVSGMDSQLAMMKALNSAEKQMQDALAERASHDPRVALEIAEKMLDTLRSKINKKD